MSWRLTHALSGPARRAALRSELLAELARPAQAGGPWPEAVAEAAADHPQAAVRSALAELAPRLAEGRSLSEALEGMEVLLGHEVRPTLAAAEAAGTEAVGEALRELERSALREENDAARLREAWLVPGITLAYAIAVFGLLGASLAPVMARIVGEANPLSLRLLPRLSMSFGEWLGVWAAACLVLALLPWLVTRWSGAARIVDRLPVWGSLRRASSGLLAARSLARLLEAGVGFDRALPAAAEVLPDGAARRELREAAARIADGVPAVEVFGEPSGALPAVLRAVLAAADGDAGLAAGLRRLARFEEAELERAGLRAAALSALCGLLVAGAFAGFVVIVGWSAYFQSLGSSPY